jgi:hypothetical protein
MQCKVMLCMVLVCMAWHGMACYGMAWYGMVCLSVCALQYLMPIPHVPYSATKDLKSQTLKTVGVVNILQ